jgi:hypothetical protein
MEDVSGTGLGETTDRLKSDRKGYNPIELAILKSEGIQQKGFWFAKNGQSKGVTKDVVESTLKESIYTAVIKKLDVIDAKITDIGTTLSELKQVAQQQLDLERRMFDQQVIEDAEKQKAPTGFAPQAEKNNVEVPSAVKTFLASLIPLGFALIDKFKEYMDTVGASISAFVKYIGTTMDGIKSAVGVVIGKISTKIGTLWTELKSGVKSAIASVKNSIKGIVESVKSFFGFGKKVGTAAEAATGLAEGARAEAAAADAARGAASGAKAESTAAKTAVKLSSKASKLLSFLNVFKGAAKAGGVLAKFAGPILIFADPMISLVEASATGNPSWDEVKKKFVKAVGALMGGEIGAAIGAFVGSVIPLFGTIIGAVAGAVAGVEAGEYLAEKLWEIVTGEKSPEDVISEIKDKAVEKLGDASTAVVDAIMEPKQTAQAAGSSISKAASNVADWWEGKSSDATKIGAPSVTGKGRPGNTTSDKAMKFFMDKGWSEAQAAGIVGNLMIESNLQANAQGDKNKETGVYAAYGIAQWHPDRQAIFRKKYGKDIRESTVEEQLDFVDWELRNNEKAAGDAIAKATTPAMAAAVVDAKYERSSGEHRQQRINTAAGLAERSEASPIVVAAAPPPKNDTIQHHMPSPEHPYSQEDAMAAHFGINDHHMGVPMGAPHS